MYVLETIQLGFLSFFVALPYLIKQGFIVKVGALKSNSKIDRRGYLRNRLATLKNVIDAWFDLELFFTMSQIFELGVMSTVSKHWFNDDDGGFFVWGELYDT